MANTSPAAAGPWTKYQSAPGSSTPGPWTRYGGASASAPAVPPAAPPVPSGSGAAGSFTSGDFSAPGTPGYHGAENKPLVTSGRDPLSFDEFMKTAESWARGISLGTSDDASAALAAGIMKARGDPKSFGDLYKAFDAFENQRINQAEKEAPARRWAEFIGAFQTPGLRQLGGWIGDAASWAGRMGRAALVGAGTGAAAGWGYSNPGGKELGTALGAGAGAVAGPVTQAAGEYLAPRVSAGAQWLIDHGIIPTRAQAVGGAAKATEEKLASLPVTGNLIKGQQRRAIQEFNQATLNNVLEPLGIMLPADQEIGREGYQAVHDILDDRFDALLPNLNFVVDTPFQTGMATLDRMADALPAAQRDAYVRTMNSQFADKLSVNGGVGVMAGDTFKGVESELGRRARGLMADPSFDNQELGRIYQQSLGVFRDALQRQNPEYGPQLTALNSAYARFTRLRDAMTKLGATEGIFTPAQLMNAVRKLDQSRGKGAFAGGNALMQELAETGKNVLGNRYPDSGTAGRLGMMHLLNPKVAATVGATAAPYALPYIFGPDWYTSGLSQGLGGILQQLPARAAGPAAAGAYEYMNQ